MYTRVGVWTSILFFLVLAPLVTSATYYVDSNTGIDTNNGLSTSTPIKTLSKLSTMRLNPGDNVLFNNCGTWRESFMYSSNSGTASSPITFSSYGSCNTKPKFYGSVNANAESYWTNRGNNLWESQANFTSEIYQIFYNTNGVTELGQRRTTLDTLQGNWDFYWDSTSKKVIVYQTSNPGSVGNGIELPKYSTPYNNALIYFDTAEYIIFKNIEISYARYNGLEDYRGNHNEFRNLDFKYIYAKAAWLEGNNVILSDSSFYKSGIRGSVAPEGQGSQGENVWITQIQNPIITNNIIERCGGVCINFFHTTGGSATNNKVFNCEQDPADWSAAIYYDGCNNSIISYNEISDCQIGLQAGTEVNGWNSKNLTFQHNVVIDSAISSIIITSELGKITNYDININHNTFYNTKYVVGSGFGNEVFIKYFDKLIFKDNIVYNTYTNTNVGNLLYIYMGGTYGTGLDSNYNSWNSKVGRNKWYLNSAQLYSNLSAWQSGQNQDKNSVITVPTFVSASNDDYRLLGNNTLCTASSTGSYVGALPCAGGTPAPYCGDGSCNGVENCSTCASDCGICPPPANTAPTQGTPLLRASDNPYNTTDATLNCYNQSTTDADGDSVTNTYRWYRNNTLMSGLTSSSVSSSNTAPGNVWKCEVRPYDGKTYGVARNSTSLTINALPDITSVKFNSTTPNNYSTDDLTCYASASGALNGITVYYIVYNGSRVYSTGSKSVARNTLTSITTVDSSLLIPNQAWKCSVRASYNGVVNESSWNNASVTIRAMPIPNIAPTHANPILRASDNPLNGTDATLTCYNQSTHDADGDSVTNTYKWYRNNVLVGSQTTSTLSSSITSIGETWKCEVRPYDGKDYGESKNSSTVTIRSVCNNNVCESGESCDSCSADCGICQSTDITSCTLTGRTWNEDTNLSNAYNLSSCFYDPLGHTLIYRVSGNSSIKVQIIGGVVSLATPIDWNGAEDIIFTAIDSTNYSRRALTDTLTLTVNPVADCGDSTCDASESCSTCSIDCGTCPVVEEPKEEEKSSRGGGGGGGGSSGYIAPIIESPTIIEQEDNQTNNTLIETTEVTTESLTTTPTDNTTESPAILTDKNDKEDKVNRGLAVGHSTTGKAISDNEQSEPFLEQPISAESKVVAASMFFADKIAPLIMATIFAVALILLIKSRRVPDETLYGTPSPTVAPMHIDPVPMQIPAMTPNIGGIYKPKEASLKDKILQYIYSKRFTTESITRLVMGYVNSGMLSKRDAAELYSHLHIHAHHHRAN